MPPQRNTASVRRLFEEAFNTGDEAVIDELVAPDFVEHQNGAQGHGPDALRRIVRGLRASFPDLQLQIEDTAESGDDVWTRLRGHGTDTGGVAGRPPSGRRIEVDVIDIIRFRDGRMAEHWGVADRLGMLQQVGVIPPPPARGA
jgi:steroid delta-isomerase-like uncharacterized protein